MMKELNFSEMQRLQNELQEKYKEKWGGLFPEKARLMLLWMYGELGEVGDVIKKNSDAEIMQSPKVREHFIEEMCDVMMYFNDIMLCYQITPEEVQSIYLAKHSANMKRW